MAKKEQSPLSKLNLALVGIDALLATMDDRNNKQLIIMAQKRIEEATEALITIQTTLGNL